MNWLTSHKKPLLIILGVIATALIAIGTWVFLKLQEPLPVVSSEKGSSTTSQTAQSAQVDSSTSTGIDSLQTSLKGDSSDDTSLSDALNDNQQQITVPTE